MRNDPDPSLPPEELKKAIDVEVKAFEESFLWLEKHMPPSFFKAIDHETKILIARNLMSFCLQDYFSPIYFKHKIIVLCHDAPNADLKIFKKFKQYVIRYYRDFTSNAPAPHDTSGKNLRIAFLYFYDLSKNESLTKEKRTELFAHAREHNPNLKDEEIEALVNGITPNFLNSMKGERLSLALSLFFKAKNEEQCQYEVWRKEDWQAKEAPSLQLVLAWRNVPKSGFLYRLAKVANSHNLTLRRVVGTYIDLSSTETILILSLGLHGKAGKAAWEEADVEDFLREFCLIKYFDTDDKVGAVFTDTHLLTGNEAHLVRNLIAFAHQVLVYGDVNFYSYENVVEGFCRHPELTVQLPQLFAAKFHPEKSDLIQYEALKKEFSQNVDKLDTGHAINDLRRKNVLKQGLQFIDHTLKTNFYRGNKSSFAFRLDPKYMDLVPYERKDKFPELPFGIFFIRGMHFIGFNIRFKDLARGGVRTVIPERMESYLYERGHIFSEAYNLAYTQQKKNKDIPEGGAKTAILLKPFEVFAEEEEIFKKEMKADGIDQALWEDKLKIYRRDHRLD
ncbi:MAG: NAD-glutamate dehydrogenase, partial [Verrucomicrobiota bacterium]|nr:NAD-glutamate dehydrogenase [Verrucomicrobiota bacterium]